MLGQIKLDQIIWLLQPAIIGSANFSEFELVDVGDSQRARDLQWDGIGLLVSDALDYRDYLEESRRAGEYCPITERFLNRIRSFPLDWRTPEWEQLVAKLDDDGGIPITINLTINGVPHT